MSYQEQDDIVAVEIAARRGITVEQAATLVEAAEGLWKALDALGFADAYGGAEFCRIFPETVDAIHRLANPLAHGEAR
jgi:hypothetical protein